MPTVRFSAAAAANRGSKKSRLVEIDQLMTGVKTQTLPPKVEFEDLEKEDRVSHVLAFSKRMGQSYNAVDVPMNRYSNIVPYDHNRVILSDPVHGCDYLNASWVRDAATGTKREFIAAQGPMKENTQHFLQAVMENEIQTIVMLTKLKETSQGIIKAKCEQYWPDLNRQKKFGSVKVKTVSEAKCESIDGLVIRLLHLSSRTKTVEVMQYHYESWPDFGVPYMAQPLVDLAKLVQSRSSGSQQGLDKNARAPGGGVSKASPVLVHCSAGVGRTGTFIGLMRAMECIAKDEDESLDVFAIVLGLRKERTCMVQKPAQYVFLYQAIDCHLRNIKCIEEEDEGNDGNPEYIYYST